MRTRKLGIWLKLYKGGNPRVQQVRDWLVWRIRQNGWKAGDFPDAESIWKDLCNHDCPPDWVPQLLVDCTELMKQDKDDFSVGDQIRITRRELAKP